MLSSSPHHPDDNKTLQHPQSIRLHSFLLVPEVTSILPQVEPQIAASTAHFSCPQSSRRAPAGRPEPQEVYRAGQDFLFNHCTGVPENLFSPLRRLRKAAEEKMQRRNLLESLRVCKALQGTYLGEAPLPLQVSPKYFFFFFTTDSLEKFFSASQFTIGNVMHIFRIVTTFGEISIKALSYIS